MEIFFKGWFFHDNHFEWKIFRKILHIPSGTHPKSPLLTQFPSFYAEYSEWMCAGGRAMQAVIQQRRNGQLPTSGGGFSVARRHWSHKPGRTEQGKSENVYLWCGLRLEVSPFFMSGNVIWDIFRGQTRICVWVLAIKGFFNVQKITFGFVCDRKQ